MRRQSCEREEGRKRGNLVIVNPLVSIIVPLFNRADLISETLDSVLAQTDARWECLIVDDGSTDQSMEVAQSYIEQDERFSLQRNKSNKHNANVCRNLGISKARGDYIIFLDSDDLLVPERVASTIQDFESFDGDALIYKCELFEKQPGDLGFMHNRFDIEDDILAFLCNDLPWLTSSGSWRTEAVKRIDGWDEELVRIQDWYFHMKALLQGATYRRIAKLGYYWRQHPGSMSSKGMDRNIVEPAVLSARKILQEIESSSQASQYQSLAEARIYHFIRTALLEGYRRTAYHYWKMIFRESRGGAKWRWLLTSFEMGGLTILVSGQRLVKRIGKVPYYRLIWPKAALFTSRTVNRWREK